jgi:hypothetical protein
MKNLLAKISLIGLIAYAVGPVSAQATSQLSARSVLVSSSAGAATGVTYTIGFTLSGSQTLGSIKFEICDSPVNTTACAGTGDSSGASLGSATFGSMSLGTGWSIGSQTGAGAGGTSLVLTHSAASLSGAATVVLNNVTNPTVNNKEYYLRISTYDNTIASSPAYPGTDYGAVALDTANQVQVQGYMPESLVFCVGTSGTDCSNIVGSAVNLGTFSPTATSTGTSVMSASTNASSGYVITINGPTMTSGANTIPGLASQTASTTGTSQFGLNLGVSGGGTGSVNGNYSNGTLYRFNTGDTVGSVGVPTNANLFTSNYIVNVGGSQAAGLYTATLTYICTATF